MIAKLAEAVAAEVPSEMRGMSGHVFYSGSSAFSAQSDVYFLGLNPGGNPGEMKDETIGGDLERWTAGDRRQWSEYRDGSWNGASPGAFGMQPRVLHLFRRIGLNPEAVPASNLVFCRSPREASANFNFDKMAEACWGFHRAVIRLLGVRLVVVCHGRAAKFVCAKLGATEFVAEFREQNRRKWRSVLTKRDENLLVARLSHPGVADWTREATDPSGLVLDGLKRLTTKTSFVRSAIQ